MQANLTTSDQLTGLQTTPLDVVDPVRVEVLNGEQGQAPALSLDLQALRQTIATAEERLNGLRDLRQELQASQQQVLELTQEREQLREALSAAHQHLAEVKALQLQLQTLLEHC